MGVLNRLRENAPAPRSGQNYHQWLSGQFGLKKLLEHMWMLIGMATACRDMAELRQKMAERFGRERVQLTLYLPPPSGGSRGGTEKRDGQLPAGSRTLQEGPLGTESPKLRQYPTLVPAARYDTARRTEVQTWST